MSKHNVTKEQEPSTRSMPDGDESKQHLDDAVEEQSKESFPASDAPSFTPLTSISPPEEKDTEGVPEEKMYPMRKDGGA